MDGPGLFQSDRSAAAAALTLLLILVGSVGCSDRQFLRGLLAGHLMGDHEDFQRRAQFDGHMDRVEAYEGSQAVGGP